MQIRVLVDSVNYNDIVTYYNENKPADEAPLERLDRFEGGFKIAIPEMKDAHDENNKIRQLRWSNRQLLQCGYIGFTKKQTMMLYEALVYSLKGNVILE
jgi:hypothetical protein